MAQNIEITIIHRAQDSFGLLDLSEAKPGVEEWMEQTVCSQVPAWTSYEHSAQVMGRSTIRTISQLSKPSMRLIGLSIKRICFQRLSTRRHSQSSGYRVVSMVRLPFVLVFCQRCLTEPELCSARLLCDVSKQRVTPFEANGHSNAADWME